MTTQYSVAFLRDTADTDYQRMVLATLPNRFSVASDHHADILVIDNAADIGQQLDAIDASTRAVFLSAPGKLSAAALERIQQRAGARPIGFGLLVASAFGNAVESSLQVEGAEAPVLVDVAAEVSSSDAGALRAAAFEQLMLLNAIAGQILGVRLLAHTATQLIASVHVDSAWRGIRLVVRHGFRDHISLHAVSRSLRREVKFARDPHAQPTAVAVFDALGSRTPMPVYQGGYRQSWLWLHDALAGAHDHERRLDAAAHVLSLMHF